MKFNEQIKINKTPENENLPSKEDKFNHLKNIEEVFKLNPELENIAVEAIKSGETISLYRIENKNIEKEPDGITSHKDLKGQWFTPSLETAISYLRKSQQTFGTEVKQVEGANLVVVKIPKEEYKNLHVSKHPIASQMDVENDNYIIPEKIERNYISLDNVQDKVGNFENLQKAKEQIKEKVKQFEIKEAVELYHEYLKTIFPDSKVKDVFYHGSPNKNIESFLSPQDELYVKHENTTTGVTGVYFADSLDEAKRYTSWNEGESGKVYPVVLDIQKFFIVADKILDGINGGFSKSILWNIQKGMLDTLKNNDINAFIAGEHMVKTEGFKEVVVLNTNKIHILGSKQDMVEFKEFIFKKNENKIQSIEDISFEEVSADTSDSIEIKVYKDDSEEIVLKKLKEKLIQENWWLQEEWKNEGFPKEQFTIPIENNKIEIFNFNKILERKEIEEIIESVSYYKNLASNINFEFPKYILLPKREDHNNQSNEPFYGRYESGIKSIILYPRAISLSPYRVEEISSIKGTLTHELGHILINKNDFINEWVKKFEWNYVEDEVFFNLWSEEKRKSKTLRHETKSPQKCITEYAQVDQTEDICESVVGYIANATDLDSEKRKFIDQLFEMKGVNVSLNKNEKVELPKLPENIKFHKKEVSKISIIL